MIQSGRRSGNIKSDDREMLVETSQQKQKSRSELPLDFEEESQCITWDQVSNFSKKYKFIKL